MTDKTAGNGLAYRKQWGGELLGEGGARFRLWAPGETSLALRLNGEDRAMDAAGGGWFELTVPEAKAGDAYSFVLADGLAVPDPAARAQHGGLHGPSLLVDPTAYRWRTDSWRGRPWHEAVHYELHVGTFTPQGTFRSAIEKLDHLRDLGVTVIELMPVAQFPGTRGWGYDGALIYAPHPGYGTPDDLRALVDAAHERGLMVMLDVIYNHFGPEGNYLARYAPGFFHPEKHTPWGAAIAYETPAVRSFFVNNALAWLTEYRLDGLRLDAIDHIHDPESDPDILVDIAKAVRAVDFGRPIHLTTEDNRNVTHLHERGEDGAVTLYSAEWNDDFHHCAHVIATGEEESYYVDFIEHRFARLARALAEGYVYQGERSGFAGEARGRPSAHLPPTAFVDFIQNHDQIGNRAFGERLTALAPKPVVQALQAVVLLSPHVPLIFMGEEWGETRPFTFFTDFEGELADLVRRGRRREFAHFAAFHDDPANLREIPDPNLASTFEAARLDWSAPLQPDHAEWLAFTRRLLAVRATRIAPLLERAPGNSGRIHAVANATVDVAWRLDGAELRIQANFGDDAEAVAVPGGEMIYVWPGADADERLPPRSVRAFLAPAERP